MTPRLTHELLLESASRRPADVALAHNAAGWSYEELAANTLAFAAGLRQSGLRPGDRVGVWLEKRAETVVALFGAMAAGAAMVPINPVLKADQVAHILRDCGVSTLVTTPARVGSLRAILPDCRELSLLVLPSDATAAEGPAISVSLPAHMRAVDFRELPDHPVATAFRAQDSNLAAILYTSGSSGKPKGVMLSHRNLVSGAQSVVSYLENGPQDVLLSVLPLSFDAGFSQLTTAFLAGAQVALLDYLLPRDVLNAIQRHGVTGITAVPPLWIRLGQLEWPTECAQSMRYFANTGGHLPLQTLQSLRQRMPKAKPFLMYGLTEAFRATYLPPEEVDRRPDSIGKAIPGAKVLVLRPDGTECCPDEPGELVQLGPHVAMGYWNRPEATAERFRPLPLARAGNLYERTETAVFSGDTVRRDADGFIYFIGRRDELIKTSGYRVSPTEVEEALLATGLVAEAAAFGVADPVLGQAIVAVVQTRDRGTDVAAVLREYRHRVPFYMVPARIVFSESALPRTSNGKIDRQALAANLKPQPASNGGSGSRSGAERPLPGSASSGT